MVPALTISLLAFCFLLLKSADFVVVALRRISKRTKTGVFALSAIIMAIGTSLPELFVGITSAIEKAPNLALGVVLGSNVANISLIAGFAALIVGRVYVHGELVKKEILIALAAGLVPIFLILDGNLNRIDGLILLTVYAAYTSSFFKSRYQQIAREHKKESFFYRFLRKFSHVDGSISKEFGRLFVGVALLLFAADYIVRISEILASYANIPLFVVGLIVVAIGTSLPELAFSFRSLEDHEPGMFFGNLLGSTIANSTLIVGVTAVINPLNVVAITPYIEAVIAFIVVFLTFWVFVKSKARLDRWEALVLVLLYIVFIAIEFGK
jgi:cation:H+ antiporter